MNTPRLRRGGGIASSLFILFFTCIVDQNWLERNFSGFLLRTLVVGRRQHSESIEVALEWSKEV